MALCCQPGTTGGFGGAVALTGDAMRLAAGADGDEKVFLFEFSAPDFGGVPTLANTLEDGSALAGGGTLDAQFSPIGRSVAVNAAGDRLAVGETNGAGGAVRLFELNPADWSADPEQSQQLRRNSPLADGSMLSLSGGREFGAGVSFDDAGNQLAVGQIGGFGSNEVFLFDLNSMDLSAAADLEQVIETGTVLASGESFNAATGDFGAAVSLTGSGDRLAVGAPGSNRVQIFDLASGFGGSVALAKSFGEASQLANAELNTGSGFGQVLAINGTGSRIAVEAARRVYLFDADPSLGTTPQLASVIGDGTGLSNGRLLSIDLSDSQFGSGLALNAAGDILAVGDSEFNAFEDGAVFLFRLDSTDLSLAPKQENVLTRDTLSGGQFIGIEGLNYVSRDMFGRSVSLNAAGDVLVVGAEAKAHLISLNPNDLAANPVLFQTIEDGSPLAGGGTFTVRATARRTSLVRGSRSMARLIVWPYPISLLTASQEKITARWLYWD